MSLHCISPDNSKVFYKKFTLKNTFSYFFSIFQKLKSKLMSKVPFLEELRVFFDFVQMSAYYAYNRYAYEKAPRFSVTCFKR